MDGIENTSRAHGGCTQTDESPCQSDPHDMVENARGMQSSHCSLEEGLGVAARRGQKSGTNIEFGPREIVVVRIIFSSMLLWRGAMWHFPSRISLELQRNQAP